MTRRALNRWGGVLAFRFGTQWLRRDVEGEVLLCDKTHPESLGKRVDVEVRNPMVETRCGRGGAIV